MRTTRIAAVFAVCLIACARSVAQSASSEISGHVSDPSGASVPETRIEVRNLETGVERWAMSNAEGYFVVPLLAPGDYRVFVSKEGFRPIVQGRARLGVNGTLKLDVALSVGSVSEAIQVMPDEPLLQRATTEIGTVIESRTLLDLPLNGRDFQQLLSLAPGVNGRSVNGQWGAGNLYHLDGVNNTTVLNAAAALVPVLDAVQEFKVQSHNDKAEYGGVLGGIVNVVSKSGTNTLHGSTWEFVRNDKLDARNPFTDATRKGPTAFRQNQFGGTLGGAGAAARLVPRPGSHVLLRRLRRLPLPPSGPGVCAGTDGGGVERGFLRAGARDLRSGDGARVRRGNRARSVSRRPDSGGAAFADDVRSTRSALRPAELQRGLVLQPIPGNCVRE